MSELAGTNVTIERDDAGMPVRLGYSVAPAETYEAWVAKHGRDFVPEHILDPYLSSLLPPDEPDDDPPILLDAERAWREAKP